MRRHAAIFGITTSDSEKQGKRKANRRLRRAVRHALTLGREVLPALREVSNVWAFDKDDKRWRADATPRDMRR